MAFSMRATFVNTIFELAKIDPRICYLASDLQPEILDRMKAEMPGRSFMFGVSEQAMVDTAVGLALEGMVPWCHTIATFLTRKAFEQIALAAQQNLPIRLLGNGGGLIYAPLGPTHLSIDDIALMRSIPNMTVIAPGDANEALGLAMASRDYPDPIYYRVGVTQPYLPLLDEEIEIGRAHLVDEPDVRAVASRVLIVSTGSITAQAIAAAHLLDDANIPVRVLHCHTVKPLDIDYIVREAQGSELVVTVEEHSLIGGLASAVADALMLKSRLMLQWPEVSANLEAIGIPDVWPDRYGTRDDLLRLYGLQPDQIAERIKRELDACSSG